MPLWRFVGWALIALGAAGVLGLVTGLAFGDAVPQVLRYANWGAAVAELGLGIGVLGRRRGAWAFAVSLECTLGVVNLLGLADLLRAGTPGTIAIVFAGARSLMAALLIITTVDFKKA